MLDWVFYPVAAVYFLISALLFVFGANYLYLSILTWVKGRQPSSEPEMVAPWPTVTVQLPIYNELYVAERLIKSVLRLDYPPELLQIQVLDDSTDETKAIVSQAVLKARKAGVNIEHVHRTRRDAFKAGALQAGLATAAGEFVVILDADFVPDPDFIRRTLPYLQDPKVAFVQTRWGFLNRDYSWLTFLQALAIDAHFMVEQFARSRSGYWINFNGTGGIWRKEVIELIGGWNGDALTEDLDLSYRAYLAGWEGQFVRQIVVPSELPVDINGFRRQQRRWARGSLECAIELGPKIWRAPISLSEKIQATLHMSGYGVYLLLFLLTLIYPLAALFASLNPGFDNFFGLAYLFSITSLAPTLFFITGQQQQGRPWWRWFLKLLTVSILGTGMMVNTVQAAWEMISKRRRVFERTAKFGVSSGEDTWLKKKYQNHFNPIAIIEVGLGFYCFGTAWYAGGLGIWGISIYAFLFGCGLFLVAGTTIIQNLVVSLNRTARRELRAGEKPGSVIQ